MSATHSELDSQNPGLFEPLVHEYTGLIDLEMALYRFSRLPHSIVMASSSHPSSPSGQRLGRFSFLAADPFEWFVVPLGRVDPFSELRKSLQRFKTQPLPELPPFQGGWAGLISYDTNRSLEQIAGPRFDEFQMPAISAGLYDTVVVWDHDQEKTFIVSQGFPETEPDLRKARAAERLDFFRKLLEAPECDVAATPKASRECELAISKTDLAPQFPVPGPNGLTSNFSRDEYIRAVQQCIDYIYSGDVFQINLAQRLLYPSNRDPLALFSRMRQRNAAPFSAYFDMGDASLVSASPERFISVRGRKVETRPIKGTRKRTRFPQVDLAAQTELAASEKDRAENIMIVDLMRNDLSRVCEDASIEVTQLCELERYESVLHLVSAVQGTLREDASIVGLLEAVFPGGSITGAPKVRAMEIISELEPTARGAYCGSLGYIGFDGSADFNILIRTITDKAGWLQIPVGGGIVAQSNPEKEYEETWTKAAGMLRALGE